MNKFKNRKTKRAVEHTPFLKKIAACQSVSQCVCEIVKLSGFERPQKIMKKYSTSQMVMVSEIECHGHGDGRLKR
jgi:hypothetical protein